MRVTIQQRDCQKSVKYQKGVFSKKVARDDTHTKPAVAIDITVTLTEEERAILNQR